MSQLGAGEKISSPMVYELAIQWSSGESSIVARSCDDKKLAAIANRLRSVPNIIKLIINGYYDINRVPQSMEDFVVNMVVNNQALTTAPDHVNVVYHNRDQRDQ